MSKTMLKKEKWTLSFNSSLKHFVVQEAKKTGVYPVNLLEQIVRERFNFYGHSDIKNSARHTSEMRKKSRIKSDKLFLNEIFEWQKSNS